MKHAVLVTTALLFLAGCNTQVADPEQNEDQDVVETEIASVDEDRSETDEVTENEETDAEESEAVSEETTEDEESSTTTAAQQESWDAYLLSAEGKAELLAGQIPETNLEIGSTLTEVESELGSPDSEGYLAGAPIKTYGKITVTHLMDQQEIVGFHLAFEQPVTVDALYAAWGKPSEVAPMEIDDITEVHNYFANGYVGSFQLTETNPTEFTQVYITTGK